MGVKTPPYANYPAWTTARQWAFVRSALRSAWSRHPVRFEALRRAERPYKGTDKRRKKEWQCAECESWNKSKDVSVDHIIPAGSLKCLDDLPGFVERLLFIPVDQLQVLCSGCHGKKSQQENAYRREQQREE